MEDLQDGPLKDPARPNLLIEFNSGMLFFLGPN
jgi:hypothetical protein